MTLPWGQVIQRSQFGQFYRLMSGWQGKRLRRSYSHTTDAGQARAFFIQYEGEGVDDHGGPYRAALLAATHTEPSGALRLLTPSPNASQSGSVATNRDKMVFNSAQGMPYCGGEEGGEGGEGGEGSTGSERPNNGGGGGGSGGRGGGGGGQKEALDRLDQFRFWGKLVALAVRHRLKPALNMPGIVWKPLVAAPVNTVQDLAEIDGGLVRYLGQLRRMSVDQVRELTFSFDNGGGGGGEGSGEGGGGGGGLGAGDGGLQAELRELFFAEEDDENEEDADEEEEEEEEGEGKKKNDSVEEKKKADREAEKKAEKAEREAEKEAFMRGEIRNILRRVEQRHLRAAAPQLGAFYEGTWTYEGREEGEKERQGGRERE